MRSFIVTFAVISALISWGTHANAQSKKRATKDDYAIDLKASATSIDKGKKGDFSVLIKAKNGLKIHPEAPLTLKLTTTPGISLTKTKLSREDASKKGSAKSPNLRTTINAKSAGDQTVTGDLSFFLCSKDWCERVSEKVQHKLKVK